MQNCIIRRSLVCGILLLFIGLSVTSSISGDIGNKLPEKTPTYHPLNNYVNAYWKFDEGSGNTLEDSSGNDHDGTIYGATWVTGYSGYALDFDGVNDYVKLDEHAEELGFNKTDDFIYSFRFKSTDEG